MIYFHSDRWNYLLTAMEARELKLIAAGEIHRFNRDVADALERIHEKINEIPEETGKDYNSCELLLRNMENFENDLVPLEAQLQVGFHSYYFRFHDNKKSP